MLHPYTVLKPEYERLLRTMQVAPERVQEVDLVARALLRPAWLDRYREVDRQTKVPACFIAGLDERESGADPSRSLGQGDYWNRVSTHVPKGHGPWASWIAAAIYYVNLDKLNATSAPWSWAYACWKGEAWNGFGARGRGINTGYLWAGTNHYTRGKYIADGVWSSSAVDRQLGIIPIMRRMVEMNSSLRFTDIEPVQTMPTPAPAVLKPPVGVGGGPSDTEWIQRSINHLRLVGIDELVCDGNYGRRTREAVRTFQKNAGIEADGLCGPKTYAALLTALSMMKPGQQTGKGVIT